MARVNGFFQTSMYVPYNMLGDGFKVACGSKGDGGEPNLGKAHADTVRARETGGLAAANYGSVTWQAVRPPQWL